MGHLSWRAALLGENLLRRPPKLCALLPSPLELDLASAADRTLCERASPSTSLSGARFAAGTGSWTSRIMCAPGAALLWLRGTPSNLQ